MKFLRPFLRLLPGLVLAGALSLLPSVASAQFAEVTREVGLSKEAKKSWGNPIWGDMNNDGFLDLIVPTHGLSVSRGPFVYLNEGGASFRDIRGTAHVERAPTFDSRDWHGFSFGDYDSDGNLDIYVTEGAKGSVGGTNKRDLLFHGNGDGTFAYASETAGLFINQHRGRCSLWFDYDNDGRLDLFVKNYGDVNDLYQNNGNGTFTPVPDAAGLGDATSETDSGAIIAMADYDNDGRMDMAITGDGNAQSLYHQTSDGTYLDVSTEAGFAPVNNSKGLAWGDYDNDGLIDLYIAHGQLGKPSTGGILFHNNGNGTFTDVTAASRLPTIGNHWVPLWGDYDNDGYLDLFVTSPGTKADGVGNANILFHNNGNSTFTDVAAAQGLALQDNFSLHKAAAFADYNNDGFLDLILKDGIGGEADTGDGADGAHRLFRNTPNDNHFIKINLRGVQSNRHGIGARVQVTTSDGLTCYRQALADAGGNYFSQSSLPLHFGIGSALTATVTITWPSHVVDTISDVAANSTIRAVEGRGPRPTPTPTATPTPTPAPPVITEQPASRRIIVGQTAKLVVVATGDALTYQWKKNGSDLPGATSETYTTPPTTLMDDGTTFDIVVGNPAGSVTSKTVQLGVSAANSSPH
ncbi:MAG: CRTAC1 family protein [Verrucomicrobiota bacterium]|nr:CRTAC1 family protein [Verrucomicrobiota bacterium]